MARTRYKTLLLLGFLIGAVAIPVIAVTFDPGDAGKVTDGVPFGAPSGTNVTIEGETNVVMETDVLFPQSDTVQFKTEAGNITFSSTDTTFSTVDVDNITGTFTNITNIDATSSDLTINPEDKRSITVGKDIDRIEFRDAGIDNGQVDFVYAGTSGTSKIVVSGLQSNTQVGAIDTSSNSLLGVTTTNSNGVATFDSLPNSEHTVALQTSDGGPSLDSNSMSPTGTIRTESPTLSIDVSDPDFPEDNVTLEWYVDGNLENTTYAKSGGTQTAEVGPLSDGSYDWYVVATDEYGQSDTSDTKTFTIDHYDPQISTITPNGLLDAEPSQISADVSDKDFNLDGDSVTVDISLDGSQIGSQTITSNQTVSTSMPQSGQTGGEHTITYEASDSYGEVTTETVTYSVPDNLTIRNELNYSELVPADGEVRFFGADEVYSRTAPNGIVDLDELPVNQEFIVEVEPTNSNFTTRTIYFESIYEQQSAYVLNRSAVDTIQSRFVLSDPTGQYGPSTLLKIQKPVNISNSVTYQTIVSDEFGVEGVTSTLEKGQRYRLIVASETDSQIVGPYRADVGETVEVEPGTPTINLTFEDNNWAANAVLKNTTLEYLFSDPTGETDSLTVWIHERNNQTNLLQANQTYTSIGNASGIVSLTTDEKTKEWVVNFVVDRDGEQFTKSVIVSNNEDISPPVDSNWTMMIGITLLVLLGGAFSVLNAAVGAVVVSLTGGILWYLGFLGGATGGAAVVVALFVSILGAALTR